MENKALGKGLSALIPEKLPEGIPQDEPRNGVAFLKTASISDNSLQPRTNYADDKLGELKASIKEKGVLQPILVRKKNGNYEVVAGERRLRAARALDLEEVPVIVKELSDQDALVIALVENIQREELNPIEEAEAFKRLIEEFHYTQDAVAQSVGKDRATISNLLRLLKLPMSIQKMVYDSKVSMGHARALLGLDSVIAQEKLAEAIVSKGISVRETEALVRVGGIQSGQKKIKKKEKNQDILALEADLRTVLGTKVSVLSKKNKGKLIIEYYSLDDLDRILEKIKGKKVI
ncbi:Chromosome (plasmid) partitioning protein ParB [hydrothermal vent metagenome]|uniref:Chromosome (Plasmid) partitioning protein ParB n=1 Tax=hydrothermal vent metagenome TaxID=652676 RepID=A0A3B1DF48_9ZZZZ